VHLELMVRAGQRGRGLGARLLDAALGWARGAPGVRRVDLIVFADNAAAVGLYRSRGFRDEGRRAGAWLDPDGGLRDDLLMALLVPD
jgi:putative acetyltransferase